jgi:hypothetical protein
VYGDCIREDRLHIIGKSKTNNLPAHTDLTENPYAKKKLFLEKDATQKSARLVLLVELVGGIAIELEPREPIFEKCPHLREKGGVLTKIRAYYIVYIVGIGCPVQYTRKSDFVLYTMA